MLSRSDSYYASPHKPRSLFPIHDMSEEEQNLIEDAYHSAFNMTETESHVSQPGMLRSLLDPSHLKSVDQFYENNVDGTHPRNISDSSIDFKSVEESLNSFTDSAQALIKGLRALGQVHPFIGVAVGAFALVVTLDLTRRDNDRKVLAVKVQMQDLMSSFFELRQIRDPEAEGFDGMTVGDRLKDFMVTIAKDIKACGSACDAYLKKNFLAKAIKSSIYESRLADFVVRFADHKSKLEHSLAIHTSLGVDFANEKLDNQERRLSSIEEKLNMMLLFRKLDSPRERDVQSFLDDNGGAKACLYNDALLEELVFKSGDSLTRLSGHEGGRRSNDLPEIRKKLSKELQEDIDEALSRNMIPFERKLDIQGKQLTEAIQQESNHIISTLLSGAHDRIIDPVLQKIWKDMGWKGSVKARHFVLALHDYYTDRQHVPESSLFERASLPSPPPSAKSSLTMTRKRTDDRWALAYINAAYVQPILEAVDDDGTGFVSVKEVNDFVASRPEGWSLPPWIAFWAVGWQASISQYKIKIYSLVQKMFQTLEFVLTSNRRAVDEYLFHASFWRIELLLRSTRSVNPKVFTDPDLIRMTESYSAAEEERIDQNLQDVGYELDTPATVSLVTGVGRIERYVFPLLYLLLKRHLKVVTLACKHVLDTEEFVSLNESLVSILLAVDYRVQNVEAVFKQTHLDVQARLGNFAFGVFQLSYGDIRRVPTQNTFGTWANEEDGTSGKATITFEDVKEALRRIPRDILKCGIQDGFQSTNYYEFEQQRLYAKSHPIQGTWAGHCSRKDGDQVVPYILRISIRISRGVKILGKGEDYANAFEFSGTIDSARRGGYGFVFLITNDNDGCSRSCIANLNVDNDTITARWSDRREKDTPGEVDYHPFILRRISPSLLRYRYTSGEFLEDPVRSRWAFACNAALHIAQERLWSQRFFEARFTERKRFVELTTRSLIAAMGLTPQMPLLPAEKGELEHLRRDLNPSEARFYQALAEFEIQKLPWHPSWGCDWCERRMTKCRILCTHCMAEDQSDNIDLCMVCIDKAPSKRGFTHDISHGIIKVEQTLHDYNFTRIVEIAKETIERSKSLFRSLEVAMIQIEEGHVDYASSGGSSKTTCACCGKNVLPPCWVCLVCTHDTFICLNCDSRRLSGFPNSPFSSHSPTHALARVRDSSIIGHDATVEERLAGLEQRIISLEYKVAEGLSNLDLRVEKRLTNLKSEVNQRLAILEANTEARFDTLEAVLRQVAAQTAALPAIYGQVVRDHVRTIAARER